MGGGTVSLALPISRRNRIAVPTRLIFAVTDFIGACINSFLIVCFAQIQRHAVEANPCWLCVASLVEALRFLFGALPDNLDETAFGRLLF